MQIFHISKEAMEPSEWDGGKTWELFIYPKNAVYAKRNFDFRLSTASIEKSPSNFTRFEGYRRYLAMLDNDLEMIRNDQKESYKRHELFRFDSNDQIQSFSAGNDFNLMIHHSLPVPNVQWISETYHFSKSFGFVFAVQPSQIEINQKKYFLQTADVVVILNPSEEKTAIKSSEKVIVGDWNR